MQECVVTLYRGSQLGSCCCAVGTFGGSVFSVWVEWLPIPELRTSDAWHLLLATAFWALRRNKILDEL